MVELYDPIFNPKNKNLAQPVDYPTMQTTPRADRQSPISGKLMENVVCTPYQSGRSIPALIDVENRLCFPVIKS